MLYEIIIAPDFSDEALEALRRWRNVRILKVATGDAFPYDLRRVGGGFLMQDPDRNLSSQQPYSGNPFKRYIA